MLVGRIEGQSNLRAMIQIKNNLAAFGHPKAFELAEDGFHWLGDYEITADEVLSGMVPKASKLEMAKQFLREQAERTQKDVYKRQDLSDEGKWLYGVLTSHVTPVLN